MAGVTAQPEKVDWVEELQKKVFEECVAQAQDQRSSRQTVESSSTARTTTVVPISVIINNIHQGFAQLPRFRFILLPKSRRPNFLEELRKSLKKAGQEDHVNWYEFKVSSERWFLNLVNLVQDGNNNVHLNHSDAPTEDSEKDHLSVDEYSCSDAIEDDYNSCSINQIDTNASCYSLNNSSMGFGCSTTDSMMESSEETDHVDDGIAGIDLKVRIRRDNEEIFNLREELVRAEETISELERDKKSLQTALEHKTKQYTQLRKEYEIQKEMVAELERREETCKLDLRKLEKAYSTLQKTVEKLERERDNVVNLKEKIEVLTKDTLDYKKKIAAIKTEYDNKIIEYEYLREQFEELQVNNNRLKSSYEENIQHQNYKIQDLQNINAELQSKLNRSDNSSGLSLTPPPYNSHIHSTPYNNSHKNRQDSLFTELKASGFNTDDAKIKEMKEELSIYNEEITGIIEQIDDALQERATIRNEISIPNVNLVDNDGIHTLKNKITTLLNLVKTCTTTKTSSSRTGEDYHQQPDVSPETKKSSYLASDRLFASEKQENDLIGAVTSSVSSVPGNGFCVRSDKSTSPLPEASGLSENSEASESQKLEIIIPIVEALNKIIEIKGTEGQDDDAAIKRPPRNPKQKSIFTSKRYLDWSKLEETPKINIEPCDRNADQEHIYARGDGPHLLDLTRTKNSDNHYFLNSTEKMKTLKSEFKTFIPNEPVQNIDMKFVTIRPNEKTYVVDSVVSSSEENSEVKESKPENPKQEFNYFTTPTHSPKIIPRRKLSVYHRSFDVDSLQAPDSGQNSNNEKKRSISTPDVQESEYGAFRTKTFQSPETTLTKNQLLTSYRCANTSDSSSTPSPKRTDFSMAESHNESSACEEKVVQRTFTKPVVLAPTKFKAPDSTVNETPTVNEAAKAPKLNVSPNILEKNPLLRKLFENDTTQHSRILGSSAGFMKESSNITKSDVTDMTLDSGNADSKLSQDLSSDVTADVLSSDNLTDSLNPSNGIFLSNNDEGITKKGAGETRAVGDGGSGAPSAKPEVGADEESSRSCNSGGASDAVDKSNGRAPAVECAMSSGEDSSAESECDARRSGQAEDGEMLRPEADTDGKLIPGRRRSNSCTDTVARGDKVEVPTTINGHNKENNCQKVTSNLSLQETIKEDESPKAFPSWTDERLQESGIASFPDIDSELSEHLSEEELKKKYTAFSVGLSTDRMTLSKRMILSRRHRDQAEKNFNNEVLKMQQDIKELPRQRNSVSGRVPGLRRPSLCYETSKWDSEKLEQTDNSSSITELRGIFEQAESRRHSREENNNSIRTSINNLSTITSEPTEEEEIWSNTREEPIVPELVIDNEINSFALRQNYRHPLIYWLLNGYITWKPMVWAFCVAFLLGFFMNRVVSSSRNNGPPMLWWSIEEILNQYIQVENDEHSVPRPI